MPAGRPRTGPRVRGRIGDPKKPLTEAGLAVQEAAKILKALELLSPRLENLLRKAVWLVDRRAYRQEVLKEDRALNSKIDEIERKLKCQH